MSEASINYMQEKVDKIDNQIKNIHMNRGITKISLFFSFVWYIILMYLAYINKISPLEHLLGICIGFLFVIIIIVYTRSKFLEKVVKVQNNMLDFIMAGMEYPDAFKKVVSMRKMEKDKNDT